MPTHEFTVRMQSGFVRTFQGTREEISLLRERILGAMAQPTRRVITMQLSTEDVAVRPWEVEDVGPLEPIR